MNVNDIAHGLLPQIVEIERLSFAEPWTAEDFEIILGRQHTHSLALMHEGEVAGFIICERGVNTTHVIDLAVRPDLRRRRVASFLVNRATAARVRPGHRVEVSVDERDLAAQLFWKTLGFKAKVVRHGDGDFYHFVYQR